MKRRIHRHAPLPIRIGAFELRKAGASRYDFTDPYHLTLAISWPMFVLLLAGAEIGINLIFATLYHLVPGTVAGSAEGSFFDAFFFSVETLATVGYGVMSPGSLYGHIVASTEIFCGTMFTALVTGLVFVRFSKPRAKILYATQAVVTRHHGVPTLMIRIGNGRMTLLSNVKLRLNALLMETSPEGVRFRTTRELRLLRDQIPLFPLTWTVMHPIDEQSPLFGFGQTDLAERAVRLFLTIEARDHSLSAQVFDMRDYAGADIRFNAHYLDAVMFDDDGTSYADLARISLIEDELETFDVADDPLPMKEHVG